MSLIWDFLLPNADTEVKFEGFRIRQGSQVAFLPECHHYLWHREGHLMILELLLLLISPSILIVSYGIQVDDSKLFMLLLNILKSATIKLSADGRAWTHIFY